MTQTLQIKTGPWISPDAGVRLVEASLAFGDAEVSAVMHAGDVEGVVFTVRRGDEVCRMGLWCVERVVRVAQALIRAFPGCAPSWSTEGGGVIRVKRTGALVFADAQTLHESIGADMVEDWIVRDGEIIAWLGLPADMGAQQPWDAP